MNEHETYLVTGGAGFIGSNLVHFLVRNGCRVITLDALTYAGNTASLEGLPPLGPDGGHLFVRGDIADGALVASILKEHAPDGVFNLAAESHVDRSIDGPAAFIETNVVGTFRLLEATRRYWTALGDDAKRTFRFLHVSTDEVYGSLGETGSFSETTPYAPNSPYSASKASSDHLVRAYHHTYSLPTLTTNCSNNYGPYQFPEKLIPLTILRALDGRELPVYGDGKNIRDWLYVEDHCRALLTVMERGRTGETYAVGGSSERRNIDIVHLLCDILDRLRPRSDGRSRRKQIAFVADRPGHDRRYAIDASKIRNELGWSPRETFESDMEKTVDWYLTNRDWVAAILSRQADGTERRGLPHLFEYRDERWNQGSVSRIKTS